MLEGTYYLGVAIECGIEIGTFNSIEQDVMGENTSKFRWMSGKAETNKREMNSAIKKSGK